MSILWWIAIAIVFGVVEVVTVDLIFLMLAFSAIFAGFASYAGASFTVQIITFGVAAAVLLFTVRPWGKRLLTRHTPNIQTNAQALPGRTAVVTELVTPAGGRVRLDGEIWSARSANSDSYSIGTVVFVEAIEGATAIVSYSASGQAGVPTPTQNVTE